MVLGDSIHDHTRKGKVSSPFDSESSKFIEQYERVDHEPGGP